VRITVETTSDILFRPEIGNMITSKGLRFCTHGSLLLFFAFLGAGANAQNEQRMIVKNQSGVPLDSDVDWDMFK
jgi:hypothetical protein